MRRGIRFMIMNHTLESPFIIDQGYDAQPGLVSNVEIKKMYNAKLGLPYSDCLSDLSSRSSMQTDLMKIMFNQLNQSQYSQLYCQNLCFQLAIVNACNCYMFRYPIVIATFRASNSTPCGTDKYKDCAVYVISELTANPGECKSGCPDECKKYEYDIETSTSQYMTHWYWSYLKNYSQNYQGSEQADLFSHLANIESVQEMRSNTLMINFYLNQLGYTSISEAALYTSASQLANIGGQVLEYCLVVSVSN